MCDGSTGGGAYATKVISAVGYKTLNDRAKLSRTRFEWSSVLLVSSKDTFTEAYDELEQPDSTDQQCTLGFKKAMLTKNGETNQKRYLRLKNNKLTLMWLPQRE